MQIRGTTWLFALGQVNCDNTGELPYLLERLGLMTWILFVGVFLRHSVWRGEMPRRGKLPRSNNDLAGQTANQIFALTSQIRDLYLDSLFLF
jgi:hypothetical protein